MVLEEHINLHKDIAHHDGFQDVRKVLLVLERANTPCNERIVEQKDKEGGLKDAGLFLVTVNGAQKRGTAGSSPAFGSSKRYS